MPSVVPLAVAGLGVLVHVSFARAQSPAERQRAVEAGLLPDVIVAGDADPGYSIHERMVR